VGVRAARALREQEKLGLEPITNNRLAQMAGVDGRALTEKAAASAELSFTLDSSPTDMYVVLRSKWATGRRFDLARLIGDRVLHTNGNLHPATRSATYRQKLQRAFSAEFLSPFEAVDAMLAGDYSTEKQEDIADHFNVSDLAIDTLLKNHGRIPRDHFDYDFDTISTA
jgi:Zn-dependent peptidase ImmA (M78 family)